MQKNAKLFKVILTAAFLSSCTTNYIIPAASELAKIRIYADPKTIGNGIIPIGAYTNDQCDAKGGGRISYLYTDSTLNFGSKSREPLDMFDAGFVSSKSKYETKIPAEKPFTFIFGISRSGVSSTGAAMSVNSQSCYVTLSFTPEKDAQYEAKYIDGHSGCDGKIFKLLQSSETRKVNRLEIKAKKLDCSYPNSW